MLKAILFDVDDTLIDWGQFNSPWAEMERPHIMAVYDYIHRELHPLSSVEHYTEEYLRRVQDAWMEGRTTLRAPHLGKLLVQTAMALGVPEAALDIEQCLQAYKWKAVRHTTVFPDVPDALKQLQSRGLRFGLVTNSYHPISLRDIELTEHGLLDFFPDCRISAADAGYLKPHEAIFKLALDCLGVTADEAVFVGDNLTADIAGAQAAGMRAVLRTRRNTPTPSNGLVVPDAALTTLADLPAVLDRWYDA